MLNSPGWIFYVFFAWIGYLLFLMAEPFLGPLIFGTILSGTLYPAFEAIQRRCKLSRVNASLLMCTLCTIGLFVPMVYLLFLLSRESLSVYSWIRSEWLSQGLESFLSESSVASYLRAKLTELGIEVRVEWLKEQAVAGVTSVSGLLVDTVQGWVTNLFSFLLNSTVMLLVMFSLFAEGPRLKSYLLKLSPLPDDQEERIIQIFNQMNYVTLVCNGLGGVIQGVLAGIGFWVLGLPSVVFWSFVMSVLAFIPVIGMGLVYLPVCFVLYVSGRPLAATGLLIYCSLISFVVENVYKPKFIGDRIRIHSIFVLFCIIGGLSVFGMAGVFYGPLIGILFLTTTEIYHEHYAYDLPNDRQE